MTPSPAVECRSTPSGASTVFAEFTLLASASDVLAPRLAQPDGHAAEGYRQFNAYSRPGEFENHPLAFWSRRPPPPATTAPPAPIAL